MVKRILLPLDGSRLAEQVLPHASLLAGAYGAELVLLMATDSSLRIRKPAPRYLDELAARCAREGVSAACVVRPGPAAETVAAYAADQGIDLIAMSTRGRSGLKRMVLGSVTDRVVRLTHLPVLVIRPARTPVSVPAIARIVLPLDGSRVAESVLPVARDLARQLKLGVLLVQVIPSDPALDREEDVTSGLPGTVIAEMEEAAATYLERVAVQFRKDGTECEVRTLRGRVAESLLGLARTESGCLVAMSTHGRSGAARAVLGSVADHIMRGGSDVMLVVRP